MATTIFALAACGGFDGGNPLRTQPVTVGEPTEPNDDGDPAATGLPSASSSAAGSGTASPPPSPSPSSQPSGGAFEGAPSYVATLGPTTRKAQHNFAGNIPITNPAGRPCQMCHGAAGPAPRFAFGGTVYTDLNATTPAASVEVRIIDAQGKVMSANTDADGNYFMKLPAGTTVTFPIKAGARDATTTITMKAGSNAGNCNNCHRIAGTSTPLAIP